MLTKTVVPRLGVRCASSLSEAAQSRRRLAFPKLRMRLEALAQSETSRLGEATATATAAAAQATATASSLGAGRTAPPPSWTSEGSRPSSCTSVSADERPALLKSILAKVGCSKVSLQALSDGSGLIAAGELPGSKAQRLELSCTEADAYSAVHGCLPDASPALSGECGRLGSSENVALLMKLLLFSEGRPESFSIGGSNTNNNNHESSLTCKLGAFHVADYGEDISGGLAVDLESRIQAVLKELADPASSTSTSEASPQSSTAPAPEHSSAAGGESASQPLQTTSPRDSEDAGTKVAEDKNAKEKGDEAHSGQIARKVSQSEDSHTVPTTSSEETANKAASSATNLAETAGGTLSTDGLPTTTAVAAAVTAAATAAMAASATAGAAAAAVPAREMLAVKSAASEPPLGGEEFGDGKNESSTTNLDGGSDNSSSSSSSSSSKDHDEANVKDFSNSADEITLSKSIQQGQSNPHDGHNERGLIEVKDLQVGQKLRGVVTRLDPIGAFIDVGATRQGLVRRSRMSEGHVEKDFLELGQEVDVWVYRVERRGTFGLSLLPYGRSSLQDPVASFQGAPRDAVFEAVVRFQGPSGFYVDVEAPEGGQVQGLLPKKTLKTELEPGSSVKVRVVRVHSNTGTLLLAPAIGPDEEEASGKRRRW